MNSFSRFCVLLTIGVCAVHALEGVLSDDVVSSYVTAFAQYQINFDKHYDTQEEYDKRLRAYAASMERVKELNANGDGSILFGETSHSDFLEEEKRSYGTAKTTSHSARANRVSRGVSYQPKLAKGHTQANMPDEFNWFDIEGVKHRAMDQGTCGGCWAFAGAAALEMQAVLQGYNFYNVSRLQCMQCAVYNPPYYNAQGCCGGFPSDTYEYAMANHLKFVREKHLPYSLMNAGKNENCSGLICDKDFADTYGVFEIDYYDSLQVSNAAELKALIWIFGPVTVLMQTPESLHDYKNGILKCKSSDTYSGAHHVTAVGYGPGYFYIRNSWGSNWGMKGDFMVSDESAVASCQITSSPSKATVSRVYVEPPDDEESYGSGDSESEEDCDSSESSALTDPSDSSISTGPSDSSVTSTTSSQSKNDSDESSENITSDMSDVSNSSRNSENSAVEIHKSVIVNDSFRAVPILAFVPILYFLLIKYK